MISQVGLFSITGPFRMYQTNFWCTTIKLSSHIGFNGNQANGWILDSRKRFDWYLFYTRSVNTNNWIYWIHWEKKWGFPSIEQSWGVEQEEEGSKPWTLLRIELPKCILHIDKCGLHSKGTRSSPHRLLALLQATGCGRASAIVPLSWSFSVIPFVDCPGQLCDRKKIIISE